MDANLSNRPEKQLLDLNVKAQELQVKMTTGDYLPTLGLMASYMWLGNIRINGFSNLAQSPYGQTIEQLVTAMVAQGITLPPVDLTQMEFHHNIDMHRPLVMLSLTVPLTKWSEGAYKIRKAKLDVRNAELERDKNTDLMRLEVQKAICNLDESEHLIAAAQTALEAATEQLRVMHDRYEVHLAPLSDLLDAQSKWQQAESDYIEARTQQLIYYTEYLRVTGKLD